MIIINEMLKFCLNILSPSLAKLFNLVLSPGIFPTTWNKCENYRGISIPSYLGKVFTSLLAERMQAFLFENDKLSIFQAAFRKKHGTNDHIFVLKTLITKYVKKNKK